MASPTRAKTALIPLLLVTLSLAACGKEPQGAQGAGPVPVSVVTLKPETVTLRRELPGRSSAFLVAEVRPQVDGIVLKRLFTEGGLVKKGQPLYQLDDATYRASYNSAQAALRKAEATLNAARLAARRSNELIRIQVISAQDHENAMLAEDLARAEVGVARSALESARVNLAYTTIVSPITRPPSAAKRIAAARPIPLPAPVTTIDLS